MKQALLAFALGLGAALAMADETPVDTDKAAANQASDKVEATDAAKSRQAKNEEFKPPLGFVTKKRGKLVLYCKRDSTIGTRFQTEKCYSEAQVRDYIIAQQENKRDIDRVRSTCSSGVSGGPCVHP